MINNHNKQRGFTLLELIVVIAVIATMTAVIVPRINFGGNKNQIKNETLKLAELFRRASDESIFKQVEIGVRFTDRDYQFLKLDGDSRKGKWIPYEKDMFRKREWPEGFEVEIEVAGVPIVLESSEDAKLDDKTRPHVMMLSNGEIMPDFKVTVDKGLLDDRYQVATGVTQLIEFGVVDDTSL